MTILRFQILIKVISTRYVRREFGGTAAPTRSQPFASRRDFTVFRACTDPYSNLIRRSSSRALRLYVDKREYLSSHHRRNHSRILSRLCEGCWPSTASPAAGRSFEDVRARSRGMCIRVVHACCVPFARRRERARRGIIRAVFLTLDRLVFASFFPSFPVPSPLPALPSLHRPCARAR